MGLKSAFKSIGKGLLKAAPIAASFIPGVGPIMGGLIGAGAGAASGALGGGGKKGALQGAIGGGLEGASGRGGIGPSKIPPYIMNMTDGNSIMPSGPQRNWTDIISPFANIFRDRGNQPSQGQAVPREEQQQQGRQGPIGGNNQILQQMDLRTPNLAHPLLQGINQARSRRQQPPVSQDQYTGYNW